MIAIPWFHKVSCEESFLRLSKLFFQVLPLYYMINTTLVTQSIHAFLYIAYIRTSSVSLVFSGLCSEQWQNARLARTVCKHHFILSHSAPRSGGPCLIRSDGWTHALWWANRPRPHCRTGPRTKGLRSGCNRLLHRPPSSDLSHMAVPCQWRPQCC